MSTRPSRESPASILDPEQSRAATASGGPIVVLGEAGSGKTTVIVERAAWLVRSGVPREQVLVLALARRGAEQLTGHLAARLGSEAPAVVTVHALALRMVRSHHARAGYDRPPRPLSSREAWRHLRQTLRREGPGWKRYKEALPLRTLLALLNDLVAGAANNALEPPEVEAAIKRLGRGDLVELVAFHGRYRNLLRREALLDFEGAVADALRLLEGNPDLLARYRRQYPHLLVDEFEESNRAQASLIRLLGAEGLFVAGNPGEATNSYRGGSPTYLRELTGAPEVQVLHLPACHRSAPAIQEACRRLVGGGGARPHTLETLPRDTVRLRGFSHQAEESLWLAKEIVLLLQGGAGLQEIAVLFRTGSDPVARDLYRRLVRMGVPVRSLVESASVGADPLVSAAMEALRFLLAPEVERDAHFLRLLGSPLGGATRAEVRWLRRASREQGMPPLKLAHDPTAMSGLPPQLGRAAAGLASRLGGLEPYLDHPPSELLWQIWVAFPPFADRALALGKGQGVAGGGSPSAYRAFLEETAHLQEDTPSTTAGDLVILYDVGHFHEITVAGGNAEGSCVLIATLHQVRGLEWRYVFLPGLVEDNYPLRRSPVGSLAPLLFRGGEGEPESLRERHLAEERRLLYVALSRARERVYLTHSAVAFDGSSRLFPSRYLPALGAIETGEGDGLAPRDSLEEMVAGYRRQLRVPGSAGVSPARPAAGTAALPTVPLDTAEALHALVRLAEAFPDRVQPSLWWDNLEETRGAAPPYPEGKLWLSASRLNGYRDCPLAFKYSQHLRLEDVSSDVMTMGSLFHDVLKEYHCPDATYPRTREALAGLLDRFFDPSEFTRPAIANQIRRKVSALLDLYYPRYGRDDRVIATELPFRFELGPHTVNGRIDRIDRLPDGALELIDYKSGSAMAQAEANTDIQLGLYALAFQYDRELAGLGTPGKASYLYVKNIGPRADGKRSYELTEESREKLLARMDRYIRGILAELFPSHARILESWPDLDPEEALRVQKTDPCRVCGFDWLCPEKERRPIDG